MRSSLVGFTDYSNQSMKEMVKDYEELYEYSKKILKEKANISKLKTQGDIQDNFQEIVLFSEKFVEFYQQSYTKIKEKQIDFFTVKELKRTGEIAARLDNVTGKIWHSYNFDVQQPIEKYYSKFRDYIATMIDLTALGMELEKRYFNKEENIYKILEKESIVKKIYKEIKDWIKIIKPF